MPSDSEIDAPGGVSATHPDTKQFPVYVSPSTQGKGKNTIRMELIPIACWKLDDVRFAFGSSFVLPAVKKEFSDLSALLKKHPKSPLSVFGHADPVGDDDFNKKLSGHRAESIYAVLTRDAGRWEKLYSSGGSQEGWGIASVQEMLNAVGSDAGPVDGVNGPKTQGGVKDFQTKNGLAVDGVAGPLTREKLFLAYMDFLCQDKLQKGDFLGQGADPGGKADIQGCSEFNPVLVFSEAEAAEFAKAANKGKRDQENSVNRRVLVLLFRPGTTVALDRWPCPRIDEGVDGCRQRMWSDGGKRRSPQASRRKFGETQDTVACRFYHRLVTLSPCEGVPPPVVMEWIQVSLAEQPELERKAWWEKADYGPYGSENFSAQLTNRTIAGSLDSKGISKFTSVPAGTCTYTFKTFFDKLSAALGPAEPWPKAAAPGPGPGPGPGPQPTPCPNVEIEINNTPDAKDDLVMKQSDHPPHRPKVKCRIKALGGPTSTVVLTNPDGRLRFPEVGDTTLTLQVPDSGAWVEFEISGETVSAAIGDAKIEAHCQTATGALIGSKDVTVFWFDEAAIDIATPGSYSVTGGRFTTTGGNAANLSAKARIRPAGVDCSTPQVKDLRVGIMQNALPGVTRERQWNTPAITWNPGVAAGTTVDVPTTIRLQINRPATGNDSAGSVVPLYDQPGKADTLDPNSLKPPNGCTGGGTATSFDTPSTAAPSPLTLPAQDAAGNAVGTVTYAASSVQLRPSFLTWAVIFNIVTQDHFVVRERAWNVTADAFTAGTKKAATDAADRAPTTDPVLAPLANTQTNDPANSTQGPLGPATTRFVK